MNESLTTVSQDRCQNRSRPGEASRTRSENSLLNERPAVRLRVTVTVKHEGLAPGQANPQPWVAGSPALRPDLRPRAPASSPPPSVQASETMWSYCWAASASAQLTDHQPCRRWGLGFGSGTVGPKTPCSESQPDLPSCPKS